MELSGIRQTSRIGGVNRNPGSGEHGKVLVWNNDTLFFEYQPYFAGEINSKTTDGIVRKGSDAEAGGYIWKLDREKNPMWGKEEFLYSITRAEGTNAAVFTMNSGQTHSLELGALAWADSAELDLQLPGDQRLLFDSNGSIGGDAGLTFDPVTKAIKLTGLPGIQVQNGQDTVLKSALQYLGSKNTLLGHGVWREILWAAGMQANTLIGESAGGSLVTGSWNTFIGPYAGANIASNVSRMVAIGPYAGRLENENDKFYLSNRNYASMAQGRSGALLYGDFASGWLRVNNRLEVGQEVRIGTFSTENTPLWGMNQFVPVDASTYKPQYFDGLVWRDYASDANNYLTSVTKTTEDVGTLDDLYKISFVQNGLDPLTLQLGKNAFNSYPIPLADDTQAGQLQISSADNSDDNSGFTFKSGLRWDEQLSTLSVPGSVTLGIKERYEATGSEIIFDGSHFYGRAGSRWLQLDNNTPVNQGEGPMIGEPNWLRYDGSVTAFDLSLEKDGIFLPIKGIKSTDPRIFITDNLVDNDLDFSWNISFAGNNYVAVTPSATSANVFATTLNPEGTNVELLFRPLISSDGSVQFTVTENNEIDLSATGGAGGNPNVYALSGEGSGVQLKDALNSSLTSWKLKSIVAGTNMEVVANELDLTFNAKPLSINNPGESGYVFSLGENTFDLSQKKLVAGSAISITDDQGLTFAVSKAIPFLSWIPTPAWTALGGSADRGKIEWKANFKDDIREDGTIESPTVIASINIGAGLSYNPETNTLTSLSATGGGSYPGTINSTSENEDNGETHTHAIDLSNYILKSDVPYDIDFGFNDFIPGTPKSYILDLKARRSYRIEGVDIKCNAGSLSGVSVMINGVSVSSMFSISITTTAKEVLSTGANVVNPGDIVTINLSATYGGTPSMFEGKLLRKLL